MNRKLALSATGPFLLASAALLAFGDLNPPAGPVAATGKTLTELEPRIAINAINTPGDATNVYRITQSGSYYLTGNLTTNGGKNGIAVTAQDVTIDLNGFSMYGLSTPTKAIAPTTSVTGLRVRNGAIRDWDAAGVAAGSSVRCEVTDVTFNGCETAILVGSESFVRRCQVVNATTTGVSLGRFSTVEDCMITSSAFAVGSTGERGCTVERTKFYSCATAIILGPQATVRDCAANLGTGGFSVGARSVVESSSLIQSGGFVLGDGSCITRCTTDLETTGFRLGQDCVATGCIATRSTNDGFLIDNRNVLVDCSANFGTGDGFQANDGNSFDRCRAESNSGDGFRVRFGNQIRACAARSNTLDGFETGPGGQILQCESDSNGNGGTGANILVTGYGCRVEGNSLIGGDFGIQSTSTGSIFIQNSSSNCPNHYGGIIAGNQVGPIGSAATATSPFANFQY